MYESQKVSVIIPVYNTEQFLDECLRSVSSQTYSNLEIIVVNDGSIDDSMNIIRRWERKDSRIRVFEKTNGGQSSARNLALDNATGTFVTFIDSDDFYEEVKTIEYCVTELMNNMMYDIVQFPIYKFKKNDDIEEFVVKDVCDFF